MKYKIIADSSCELPENLLEDEHFQLVPFGLEINNEFLQDDSLLSVESLLKKIAASPLCPKSSCPSPQSFLEAIDIEADHIYIITISSKLSGSYNSAILAKNMYEESHSDKKICVIDSQSASCGETQIAMLAHELEQQFLPFDIISRELNKFRDHLNTFFVLDNLETLKKNGRLTGIKSLMASTLNIKPVMAGDKGEIIQIGKGVGIRKALGKLVDEILKCDTIQDEKPIIVTHCNNPSRADLVKNMIQNKIPNAHIIITSTKGLSSLYANDGGIIVTFSC